MNVLERLQEKIEQWKVSHEALKTENVELKVLLEEASSVENEKDTEIDTIKSQLEDMTATANEKENQVSLLTRELEEKDAEIENIIAQVERLLA